MKGSIDDFGGEVETKHRCAQCPYCVKCREQFETYCDGHKHIHPGATLYVYGTTEDVYRHSCGCAFCLQIIAVKQTITRIEQAAKKRTRR